MSCYSECPPFLQFVHRFSVTHGLMIQWSLWGATSQQHCNRIWLLKWCWIALHSTGRQQKGGGSGRRADVKYVKKVKWRRWELVWSTERRGIVRKLRRKTSLGSHTLTAFSPYLKSMCFFFSEKKSSIKVQLCFFLSAPPSSCILLLCPSTASHSTLILLFSHLPFLFTPSQRLLSTFAFSSAVCVSS